MTRDLPEDGERRVLELLPWYVNGTLEGAERDEVRRALRSSLTLRREHDRLVRLQGLMQQDDAERAASGRAFERLMARIQPRRPRQRSLAWQAAAAAVGAVGLAVWLLAELPGGPQRFETLTAAETGAKSLRIQFAPGVSAQDRDALLAAHGLAIGAPPTPEGIHTLLLPDDADARAIANALRADPRVAFASMPPAGPTR